MKTATAMPGTVILQNGATVVDSKRKDNYWIVLARWERGSRVEFVTWAADADGNCYWGHYHDSIEKAAQDYASR